MADRVECRLPECVVTGFNPDPATQPSAPGSKKSGAVPGYARLETLRHRYIRACAAELDARRKKNELLKAIRQCRKASGELRKTGVGKSKTRA